MSDLVTSSAGTYDPTDDQRRQHERNMERGMRSVQIMGAISIYQNHQLSKSVETLNQNIQQQNALLHSVASSVNEISSKIDDVKHEQQLQRLKQERDDLVKETVFNFKQECDQLLSEQNKVRAYFCFRALQAKYGEIGITTKDISSIADKEYFVQIGRSIEKGYSEALATATAEEKADISAIENIGAGEFEALEELLDSEPMSFVKRYESIASNPHLLSKAELAKALSEELSFDGNLNKYYRGFSVLLWSLPFALVVAALTFSVSEESLQNRVMFSLVGWAFFAIVLYVVRLVAVTLRSRGRKQRIKERVMGRVKTVKADLFDQHAQTKAEISHLADAILGKRSVAESLATKYDFLAPLLTPYTEFSRAKIGLEA